jgi:hypothetical protein
MDSMPPFSMEFLAALRPSALPTCHHFLEPLPTCHHFLEPLPTCHHFLEPLPTCHHFLEPLPTCHHFLEDWFLWSGLWHLQFMSAGK